jgi:hypothetical protein
MQIATKYKKLIALLFCLWLAIGEDQYSYEKLVIFRRLGIDIPSILTILPWFGAAMCFFVLTIKLTKKNNVVLPPSRAKSKYKNVIGRLSLMVVIIGLVHLWPIYYFNKHIESVSATNNRINAYNVIERYHKAIEPLLNFRTVAYFSSDEPNVITVYFEKGDGRSERVNKLINTQL